MAMSPPASSSTFCHHNFCTYVLIVKYCLLLLFLINPTSCTYGYGPYGYGYDDDEAAATSKKALFVFGDSLFDAGNNQYYTPDTYSAPNHHPYGMAFVKATGRWSDGLLVPDLIAQHAKKKEIIQPWLAVNTTAPLNGANFASAGAGVLYHADYINFKTQISMFKNATEIIRQSVGEDALETVVKEAVYLFSIGGNDYFEFFATYQNATVAQMQQYVDLVIEILKECLLELYEHYGARKFAFQDVGPLGCMPATKYYVNDTSEICYTRADVIARLHNHDLRKLFESLQQNHTDIKYGIFDYYTQLRNRIINPTDYGFTEGEIACCGYGGKINWKNCGTDPYFLCSNPSAFVLFDGIHTTQATNAQLAQLMWSGNTSYISPNNVRDLFLAEELEQQEQGRRYYSSTQLIV